MINKITIISITFFSILLCSCGFKAVHQKENNLIFLQNINVVGEKRLAHFLKNNILLVSNEDSKNKYNAEIKIDKQKNSKNKDITGKVTRYNLVLSATIELTNIDSDEKLNKTFIRSLDYDIAKIHSDTINNENAAIKNIIQTLSNDMISYINYSMRNN